MPPQITPKFEVSGRDDQPNLKVGKTIYEIVRLDDYALILKNGDVETRFKKKEVQEKIS